MSRVGKATINIPEKVTVTMNDKGLVTVKGAKTSQTVQLTGSISVETEGAELNVRRGDEEASTRALHGLYRSLVFNAVHGVSTGWSKTLILNGVGYRAAVSGKTLDLTLGYSHPIKFPIPDGIEIKVEKQTTVTISGADKALVGQVSANIRAYRLPEPYLGKGIRYSDEVIRRKAGKSGGK
ncbi:MAG: 50S ribosomal protein L6 [Bdellovibrionales bacterium]